eukprot:CAMPEP_0117419772 /NCGR_PEP_ID=MMETSP0758-20121206/1261_1 /TAXON_ID=63605 /ORGANISM="Percolomonas cosmopolitus, Strain AE-1 (ATCC 50343)" /LENGTH=215 /DNA_ID=CAMNT_0005201025 /DNA_START=83 /DNA_END=726 /DNA_ORIENTATION=-
MKLSKSLIKKRQKIRNKKVRSAFDDEESDNEVSSSSKSHIEKMLESQNHGEQTMAEARKTNKYLDEAMKEDPNIFNYDSQRETIQQINNLKAQKEMETKQAQKAPGSKYIESMMEYSALRREDRENRHQNSLKQRAEVAHQAQKVVLMSESYSSNLDDAARTGALSKDEIFKRIAARDDTISHQKPTMEQEVKPQKKIKKNKETSIDLVAARLRA